MTQPHTTDQSPITSRSGAAAALVLDGTSEAIEVRDGAGRLIFRFDTDSGQAELIVPKGDLSISAPEGNINLLAGKAIELRSPELAVQTARGTISMREAQFIGRSWRATLKSIHLSSERLTRVCGRIVEHTSSLIRHVAGLHQTTSGRVRQIVRGTWTLRSNRTDLTATKDVRIDGDKINLG